MLRRGTMPCGGEAFFCNDSRSRNFGDREAGVKIAQKKNKSVSLSIANRAYGYGAWIRLIKECVQRARIQATIRVNSEQILRYWDSRYDILSMQNNEGWGTKVVERMTADLKATFPAIFHQPWRWLAFRCGGGIRRHFSRTTTLAPKAKASKGE